ncbi:MAG: thioredoxin fold domain-containing protein [Deltaproteobacteria bacterium]|nr:thioredoxin fold domain-containing protein [Deltaproteobacteria bacterium]
MSIDSSKKNNSGRQTVEILCDTHLIIRCCRCGTKNRIPQTRLRERPLCGHCSTFLDEFIITCLECDAKNRIPEERLLHRPLCGRCGSPLYKGMAVDVTDDSFKEEALGFPGPVALCVWAPWCVNCRTVVPLFDDMAPRYAGGIKFIRVHSDKNPRLVRRYNVDRTPTILFLSDGAIVKRLSGAVTKEEIERCIAAIHREEKR